MNKLTDNDIREALRRREARQTKPEVPADFCDNVMQEIAPKSARFMGTVLAAACIAVAVLMVWPKESEQKSDGSVLAVRQERTPSPSPADKQDMISRELPVKAAVRQPKITDRQLDVQQNAATATDSLDYYIYKIERELAQVDDSLYMEHIHRLMHADE